MQKVSSYIGLCAALLLGFFFLYPHSWDSSDKLFTPLDDTLISRHIQNSSGRYLFLFRIAKETKLCPQGQATQYRTTCRSIRLAPYDEELFDFIPEMNYFLPGFDKEYLNTFNRSLNLGDLETFALRSKYLHEKKVMEIYPKILDKFKSNYITATLLTHIIFIFIIFSMIWYRYQIGTFLLSLFTTPGKLIFRAASNLHRKI